MQKSERVPNPAMQSAVLIVAHRRLFHLDGASACKAQALTARVCLLLPTRKSLGRMIPGARLEVVHLGTTYMEQF